MKVSTNEKQIKELLSRGVQNIYPKREFLEKELKSGRRLTLYTGYDPTGPTLHIGHGITMLKLKQFQDLGHQVIMLIGDFTAMIGDPTDKSSVRKKLTKEEVLDNCKNYKKQAEAILNFEGDNKVQIKFNSNWLAKMNLEDFLELSANFTIQRLLERDMFQERIKAEKPVYLSEFLYPVMQGYDSVEMDVDGEVGGNDQTFNMLAGRDLMKTLSKKEKFVITIKLLVDSSSGKKMGKSEGNMIALNDSPEDMFGKVMSWTDDMILSGFELCSTLPMKEIEEIKNNLESGVNPRDIKIRLAGEIVKTFLGEKHVSKAKDYFISTFTKKEVPDEIAELSPSKNDIISVLVESNICSSNSEARRAIKQGGVKINGKKVEDIYEETKLNDVVQKGSRFFVKIK